MKALPFPTLVTVLCLGSALAVVRASDPNTNKLQGVQITTKPMIPVDPFDPAVVLSVLLAGGVAWFAGDALGSLTVRVHGRWRRALYMGPVWVIAAIALTLLTCLLFMVGSAVLGNQPGYVTDLALAAFFLPPLLGLAVAGMRILRAPPAEDRPTNPFQP